MAHPTDTNPSPPQPLSPGPAPDGSVGAPPASQAALPQPDSSAAVQSPNLAPPLPVAATSQPRTNSDRSSSSPQSGPVQTRNNDISASPLGLPIAQQDPQQPSQISFTPPAPARASQHSTSPSLVPVQRQVLCETGTASTEVTQETVNAELDGIPPPTLAKLKRRLGMAGRDVAAMTAEEKMRLVQLARRGTGTGMRSRDAHAPGVGPAQQQLQGGVAATRVVQHAHPRPPASLYLPTMQSGQTGPMFDPPYPEFRDLHGFVIPSINPLHQYGGGAGLSRQMLLQTMHQQGPGSHPQNLNPPQYQYPTPARASSSSYGSAGGQWRGGQPRTAGPSTGTFNEPGAPHHAYALRMPFTTPTRSPPGPSAPSGTGGSGTGGSGAPSVYAPLIPPPPYRGTTGFQEPTAAGPPLATVDRVHADEDFEREFAAWFEPDGA